MALSLGNKTIFTYSLCKIFNVRLSVIILNMGKTNTVDKEITRYLGYLDNQQKEVVLSVVKSFAGQEESWWEDENVVAEMNKRFAEMESGKVKLYTLDEAESIARESYKSEKRKTE
jgi:hypothetical protein